MCTCLGVPQPLSPPSLQCLSLIPFAVPFQSPAETPSLRESSPPAQVHRSPEAWLAPGPSIPVPDRPQPGGAGQGQPGGAGRGQPGLQDQSASPGAPRLTPGHVHIWKTLLYSPLPSFPSPEAASGLPQLGGSWLEIPVSGESSSLEPRG